jgi:tetratricopeptide (TPR) repeat protein
MSSILCSISTLVLLVAASAQDLEEWKKCVAASGPLYRQGRFVEATHVLERAVHYSEHFPSLDNRLPATIDSLAFLYLEQGRYSDAANLYARSMHLWEKLGPEQREFLLRSTDGLIATYIGSHNFRAAKKLIAKRVREMETSENLADRAEALNMKGALAAAERHFNQAERLYRESLALWEQVVPKDGRNVAITSINVAQVLAAAKRYENALEMNLHALEVFEKLDSGQSILVARTLDASGLFCVKLGRLGDAERFYQRALGTAKQAFGPEHWYSGQIMLRYSAVLRAMQQNAQARQLAREAHAILSRRSENHETVDILALRIAR